MELQEALKNRVHEIINQESKKVSDDKWSICQTGIKVDENGNFALIIARQSKRNWEVVENLYTVAL